jgi:hypothetical protein
MGIMDDVRAEARSYEYVSWTGEINGNEHTMFAKPIRPIDFKALARRFPELEAKPNSEGMVAMIAFKAQDENGKRMFTQKDEHDLMTLKTTTIHDIFLTLWGDFWSVEDLEDEHEEAVKN